MTVLCLSSLWGGQALAQSLAITGKVIDEAGEAVAGAGVVEKGIGINFRQCSTESGWTSRSGEL